MNVFHNTGRRTRGIAGPASGQSLMEVLVATALGALLVVAAASVIAPALRTRTQTSRVQVGAALAQELLENVRAWSEGDWHKIFNLATSSANLYYLNTSNSPFTSATGTQPLSLSTTTYTRYFYVDDVYRDANGGVSQSGANYDPSTKKVTVISNWSGAGAATTTFYTYLTRNQDFVFDQTDWSGGPNQNGPVTSVNNMFATSSNIDYATTSGSIFINLPGY